MVSNFAVFVVSVAAVMVISSVIQFKRKRITFSWASFWSAIWIIGAVTVWFSDWTNRIAEIFGQRGDTFILYLCVLALFYLAYRLYLEHKKTQADISKLVEELAKNK